MTQLPLLDPVHTVARQREGAGTTYFNEFDHFAAAWLRNLYPTATVDERDIHDVEPRDVAGFRRCHFFGGVGGWQLALSLAGWGDAEVWTGSCPCPPFSSAGKKKACPKCGSAGLVPCPRRTGYFLCAACGHAWLADERHLWPELWRLITLARPAIVFGEQVSGADGLLWLAGVRASLEIIGYRVGAADLCAASVGAANIRQRLFWTAIRADIGTLDGLAEPESGGHFKREYRDQESEERTSHCSGQHQGRGVDDVADGGNPDRLAVPQHTQRWPIHVNGGDGRDGQDSGRTQAHGEPGTCGEVCAAGRLDDAAGERAEHGGAAEPGGDGSHDGVPRAPGSRSARGLGHARSRSSQRHAGTVPGAQAGSNRERVNDGCLPVGLTNASDSLDAERMGDASASRLPLSEPGELPGAERINQRRAVEQSGGASWTVIPCRDGKLRRISAQPGDEPLAYVVPKDVGPLIAELERMGVSPDSAKRVIAKARKNRTGRLRGYGNAINPELAAVFIRCVMETLCTP